VLGNLNSQLCSKATGEKMILQFNELDVLHLEAYESSKIYKERTKQWHDKHIMKKRFTEGDLVELFNSKLQLLASKLRSQWLGPFKVTNVFPYGAMEVWSESTSAFKVNRQHLKPYYVEEPINNPAVHNFLIPSTPRRDSPAPNPKRTLLGRQPKFFSFTSFSFFYCI